QRVRIIILECGGVIGPSLIHWLLRNTDATLAGSDDRHERLDDLLGLPRFSYYAMAPRREPELLDRFIAGADAVIDLGAIDRRATAEEDVEYLERRLDIGAAVAWATAAAGGRLVRVSAADAHEEDEPAGGTGLSGG